MFHPTSHTPHRTAIGSQGVGVANSIGASSLAILLSLGLPWFLRSSTSQTYVQLLSNGVWYTMLSLLPMILIVFFVFWARKFVLCRITGLILCIFYVLFLSFGLLVERNVLFRPNFC